MSSVQTRAARSPASKAPRWTRSVLLPAVLMVLAAVSFAGARLADAAHGDVDGFVLAGSDFADPSRVPAGLHLRSGSGYDGQFYYRLALNPANLSKEAYGIRLDSPFRLQRIGYPVLAWVVSGGQAPLVPWALLVVNLAGVGVIGWLGALFARDVGRHPLWGLVPAGFWGLLFPVGHDLTEITEYAFLLGGLLALRRGRPLLAAAALTAAVLTRETAVVTVAAVGIVRLADLLRRRARAGTADLPWTLPLVIFAAWQLVCLAAVGVLPVANGTGYNLAQPFVGLWLAAPGWLHALPSLPGWLRIAQFVALCLLVLYAAVVVRGSTARSHEKAALGLLVLLASTLGPAVWVSGGDFRTQADLYLLGSVVLLASKHRLEVPAVALTGLWFATAALRTHVL